MLWVQPLQIFAKMNIEENTHTLARHIVRSSVKLIFKCTREGLSLHALHSQSYNTYGVLSSELVASPPYTIECKRPLLSTTHASPLHSSPSRSAAFGLVVAVVHNIVTPDNRRCWYCGLVDSFCVHDSISESTSQLLFDHRRLNEYDDVWQTRRRALSRCTFRIRLNAATIRDYSKYILEKSSFHPMWFERKPPAEGELRHSVVKTGRRSIPLEGRKKSFFVSINDVVRIHFPP